LTNKRIRREVNDMAVLVFAVVLAALALAEFGPGWIRRHRRHRAPGPDQPPAGSPAPLVPDLIEANIDGEREEMRLAEHLVAGELPREQYRHHMTELAAQDAKRHPIVVPPERGNSPTPQ